MRCLRRISGIKWQDRVPNTEVLHLSGITGIEAFLLQAQFRWVGHVVRMQDNRIPKQIFYGQLSSGKRPQCGPVRRYKDTVRVSGTIWRGAAHIHSHSSVPHTIEDSGVRRDGQPSPLLRKHGLPVYRGNGQPASTRPSAEPTRHGRVIGATTSAHPELGSAHRRTHRWSSGESENLFGGSWDNLSESCILKKETTNVYLKYPELLGQSSPNLHIM